MPVLVPIIVDAAILLLATMVLQVWAMICACAYACTISNPSCKKGELKRKSDLGKDITQR